jgi:hypothetical protein
VEILIYFARLCAATNSDKLSDRFMGCDYNIEGFWHVMKERIGAGRCFPDLHQLYQRTRRVLMAHHERPIYTFHW